MNASVPGPELDAIDVRTGGRWSARQWLKNTLLLWMIRGAIGFGDVLPERWLLALGTATGSLYARLILWKMRRSRRFSTNATTGLWAEASIRRCFENAGRNLALCWCLRRPTLRALDRVFIDQQSRAVLSDALAQGNGVVFVSAHLGPFEWVAAAIAELGARPAVVVRESYDPRLDHIVDWHRKRRAITLIHRGDRSAPLRIVRALRDGRPVGFLPDLGARVPTLSATFLGKTVEFPVGPQRLARRLRAPLVVGTLSGPLDGDQWRLTIRAISSGENATEAELTQRVADALSQDILRCPEQWLGVAAVVTQSGAMQFPALR